jgi:hypothetical protein
VSMPVLTDLVHDHTQPLSVRATALAALSFIAPLHLDSSIDSQWPEPTRQLGALLRSLLPLPRRTYSFSLPPSLFPAHTTRGS